MRVPLSWLREYVAVDLPVGQLAQRLTMAGLEVEEIHPVGAEWRAVTIARVVDLQPHPRADTLRVARLDLGDCAATVVTAAPNLFVGAVVPHVAPGGRLPAGEVGPRTFLGVTSEGMLCSGDELNLSPDRDGIYLLEETAPVGQPLADYLDETVLDLYITANRPDAMSVVGIAREVHALTGAPLRLPAAEPPRGAVPAGTLLSVRIQDPVGCPRFTASVVQGIELRPSPPWLQRRLHLAGVRPISNVVDVTNYAMLELGQPLHAFDRQRLHGGIVVRRAAPGERLVTLDGQERVLSPSMMVVADESGARSLAGIMGGEDSEITAATRDVVLEGASWDRATTRLTSAALNLATEASRRFGRGVDPDLTALAVARATALTLELAGGSAAAGLVDVYPGRQPPPTIVVRPSQIDALLGAPYSRQQVVGTLRTLQFGVEEGGEELVVAVPGHRRFDVAHRADLAEEVARIVGYEHVPTTLPAGRLPAPRPDGDGGYAAELLARRTLAAAGLQEVMTYSLVDPAEPARLDAEAPWPPDGRGAPPPSPRARTLLRVTNPLSVEQSALRDSLLGSLLQTLAANLRLRDRVLLFELARTWRGPLDPLPTERRTVGIAMAGPRAPAHWSGAGEPLDFFDLKGVVDSLMRAFNLRPTYAPAQHPSLHPGRAASIAIPLETPAGSRAPLPTGGLGSDAAQQIGILGQLHPRVAERFDLVGQAVLVAELDFEPLLQAQATGRIVATPSRFPANERDVAIVVDEATSHAAVARTIEEAGGPLLQRVHLFDVYRGAPIPPGRKSLAYALAYQADDRTLEDAEVAALHARVEAALTTHLGAEVRGR